MKNDWGLLEKWGKMKDLTAPLHVQEEDIMRILKVPDIEHLLLEVRHMGRYIEEEFLFKVVLSFHIGRSDARMLKPTSKVPKLPAPTSKVAPDSSSAKLHIPEWSRLGIELTDVLNEWNSEFVKIKYLQGEFKWKYDHKTKEAKVLEEELKLRASDGGLAELRALGDDSAKVRASGGGSVKARSSGNGPARVRAYGSGPAKVRPSSGGLAKLRWRSGETPAMVQQNSSSGRGGARRLELSSFSSFFSHGFDPPFKRKWGSIYRTLEWHGL
ncbi:hypothetical protein IEQ34_017925 [Dendrobium chrysotoxum]|uniref:Uncharacterized protein n=1 Tax=Dendrobium chrysotoxum TaxID=161865 RepID=A0AAV7GAZ0_DENCH|nr:hypothetical protein IEQ34_017925 [Dendrobium chrysotoxum]